MARPTIIYSFAASLDGFIADRKGGVDWLNDFDDADYGLEAFFRSIDVFVMGRHTYNIGRKLGGPMSEAARTFVLSRRLKKDPPGARLWNKSLPALVRELEKMGAKRVWMMGGGITASAFLEAKLLDEINVTTFPVILGRGIPMFGKAHTPPKRFILTEMTEFSNGAVRRVYSVSGVTKVTSKSAGR